MKGTFLIALTIMFSMLVIPLSALSDKKDETASISDTVTDVLYTAPSTTGFEKIKVLKGENIIELDIKDYIFGVVAAEMPALYEAEALKAQAVAAYTFACYRMNGNQNAEYNITADAETAQCFITREEAAVRWGEKTAEYSNKLDSCIAAVQGQMLTYDGAPIFAAYHAISSGSTNACVDVWGSDLPYLKSVDSIGDRLADGYLSEVTLTSEELANKLSSIATADGSPSEYFKDLSATKNGYVKSVNFCGKQTSGSEICKLLGLRSSNFTVNYSDGNFTFSVKGYGHGVGMSQTGADYMAKQGSSYEEILLHYYNGATLQKNKNNA